jgi:putative membrane protein insertion efficiency factor
MSLANAILKAPIHLYRWTLKPYVGWNCRHLPTCSDYALEAIDRNGAWRGFWLTVSRLSRCHPYGTRGHDPVPDLTAVRHTFAPWRYGRWRWDNR